MRAMAFSKTNGADSLKLVERDMPNAGPGQIVVKMGAASINYRDLLIAKGGYRSRQKLDALVPLSDGAGVVSAVGDGVHEFKIGDRVTACFFQHWPAGTATEHAMESDTGRAVDGMLQEYCVFPESALVHTPDNLNDAEAASLTCAGLTAWSAIVRLGGGEPGDAILTQGTGGVSLFALQFAKMLGARVAITSSSDDKLERAKALGADHGINYGENESWGQRAKEWAGGDGVDNVIELGGTETMKQSLIAVRPGGTLSLIGVLSGATTGNVLLPFIISRDVRLQGVTVGPKDAMRQMCRAIETDGMQPVIDSVFEFEDSASAYHHLASGAHFGKVCISIQDT